MSIIQIIIISVVVVCVIVYGVKSAPRVTQVGVDITKDISISEALIVFIKIIVVIVVFWTLLMSWNWYISCEQGAVPSRRVYGSVFLREACDEPEWRPIIRGYRELFSGELFEK
jgi:archaellum biogenesis protein FlaJ (TadC family)